MSNQVNRSAILSSIALAVITSTIGALINFATNGKGGVLLWVVVGLLTIISGLIPYIGHIVRGRHTRFIHRRWPLLVGSLLLLMAAIVSDKAMSSHVIGSTSIAEPPQSSGASSITPVTTSKPPVPLPGVVEPSPVNPDSVVVAKRLTAALRESQIVPAGVTIERDGSDSSPPFEFYVSQGSFKATAALREKTRSATVYIEAIWQGASRFDPACAPPNNTSFCSTAVSHDGTRIVNTVELTQETQAVTRETVIATIPNGAQAYIELSAGRGSESTSILGVEQMVSMATLIVRSLQSHQ